MMLYSLGVLDGNDKKDNFREWQLLNTSSNKKSRSLTTGIS
jgi:hypothetical protein